MNSVTVVMEALMMIVLILVTSLFISNDLYFYLAFCRLCETMDIETLVLYAGYEILNSSFSI